MHCLGASAGGQASPNGPGAAGSVLNVVRALGVLVSEGRIQGGPRGYKEGPHCVAPLQLLPNDHLCEKDNCLCDRYLVLVQEITALVEASAYLCLEVVLCSDCSCGLIKSKSKHRVLTSCSAQTAWQHSSELLLEYWSIGVVASKSPESMNSQGLYQAVRSRLHFSQVAAWWSRTSGLKPSYVATRVLQHPLNQDEHLAKFRQRPVEHTFPLAGIGDGNALEVTVWALPRMEDIPSLHCPVHAAQSILEPGAPAETSCPRASTPTKLLIPTDGGGADDADQRAISPGEPGGVIDGLLVPEPPPASLNSSAASGAHNNPAANISSVQSAAADANIVYYMSSFRSAALLQQEECQQHGQRHCRCQAEPEDAPPRAERKRRRSLPCGPPPPTTTAATATTATAQQQSQQQPSAASPPAAEPLPALSELDGLAVTFDAQLSLGSDSPAVASRSEKRLKRSHAPSPQLCAATAATTTAAAAAATTTSVRREAKPARPPRPKNPLLRPDAKPAGGFDWICARPEPATATRRVGNLQLSPREFDEVLAVLRAHTPHGPRRRSALRATTKRRSEKPEASAAAPTLPPTRPPPTPPPRNKAELLLGAILRSSGRESAESSSDGSVDGEQHPSRASPPSARRRIDFSDGPADEADDECDDDEPEEDEDEDDEEEAEEEEEEEQEEQEDKLALCHHDNNNSSSVVNNNLSNANHQLGGGAPSEDEADRSVVPSAKEQERFRRSLENAASMVFHSRTGLPLTSSPAPLRRGSCCFDFDSSLNSVSSKRSALFELNTPPSPGAVSLEEGDKEAESVCDIGEVGRRRSPSRNRPQSHALLGSFEESALNGRLEPVSTIHGFTAEIGASGSFCPKHRKLPVTVFFYTLGDNDKVSSPYLAHINLGKKGYQVPRMGTIQVTLSNPLGTVVKMFVVLYDLTDMPPRSHTFLRQRTLRDRTLRYLIHLRFMSGKSGRVYLHTDVRMIICRKSNVDTASDFSSEPPKELRSYIHGPTNPKFSPRC